MQVLVILVMAAIFARDHSFTPPGLGVLGLRGAALATLVPLALIGLVAQALIALCGRRIDQRGSRQAVGVADAAARAACWCALAWHALSVLGLGWLDSVRALVGRVFGLDDALAATPVLALVTWMWWAAYPIHRRLREAVLLREIEAGLPVHAPPTRGQFVLMHVRNTLLIVLVPMLVLWTWSSLCERALERLAGLHGPAWAAPLRTPGVGDLIHAGMQFLGIALALVFLPAALRHVWNTTPLGPGPLRDRLESLCAHQRVRCAQILVWRTHGMTVNGAVLGPWAPLRYVLLTDALLERMTQREVMAVMGHELGHVARRHIPWLLAALLTSIGLSVAATDALLALLVPRLSGDGSEANTPGAIIAIVEGVAALAAIGAGLLVFGWISRRFEWQADAFAVQALSQQPQLMTEGLSASPTETAPDSEPRADAPPGHARADAVHAMADALRAVARHNHVPLRAFAFRHGSLERRIANLHRLRGLRLDALPIDRLVARVKVCLALGLAAVVTLSIWQGLSPGAAAPTDADNDTLQPEALGEPAPASADAARHAQPHSGQTTQPSASTGSRSSK